MPPKISNSPATPSTQSRSLRRAKSSNHAAPPSTLPSSLRREYEVVSAQSVLRVRELGWEIEAARDLEQMLDYKKSPYTRELLQTFKEAAKTTFVPSMDEMRLLLDRIAVVDGARERLTFKFVKAGIPLPGHKSELNAQEARFLISDFEEEINARVRKENKMGMGVLVATACLKTALAYPFWSVIFHSNDLTGLLPSLMTLGTAAFMGVTTTFVIYGAYKALRGLWKDDDDALNDAALLTEANIARRPQFKTAVPKGVNAVMLALLVPLLAFLWQKWGQVDAHMLTTMNVPTELAKSIAPALVSFLYAIALVGARFKDSEARGLQASRAVAEHYDGWVAEEIAQLVNCDDDDFDKDRVESRAKWVDQRLTAIVLSALWLDTSDHTVVEQLKNNILDNGK